MTVQTDCIPPKRTQVIFADAPKRGYDIVVQSGLLRRLGEECRAVLPPDARILLLTDENLADRYLQPVLKSLDDVDLPATPLVIPAGERSKSLSQAEAVYQAAMDAGLTRKDAILGLGGGVIGDLAGFCASTYHRGIGVIQAPTTLVAQVDSAIGGKTGVNFGRVKNTVGTFHQPLAVLSDPDTLDSLPPRELAAGMAEVIKYGLIETSCTGESGFFEWLLEQASSGKLRDGFPAMIDRCCRIKAAVVMRDELETRGLRFFLNLGHTFGHAYESLSDYGLLHGEAVAIGMLKAVRLAIQLGLFPAEGEVWLETLYRHTNLLDCVRQPRREPPSELLARMRQDKKNRDSRIRLVLPTDRPGRVAVRDDILDDAILAVLAE